MHNPLRPSRRVASAGARPDLSLRPTLGLAEVVGLRAAVDGPGRGGLRRGALRLMLGVGLASVGGCLIPTPIIEEEPDPALPPYYLVNFVQPPFTRTVVYDPELDPEGAGIEFSTGPLDDPNDDRLFWRWFFNYGPGSTAIEDAGPIQGLGPEQHEAGIRLRVRPCVDLTARFPDTAVHRIHLVVADQPFLAEGEGEGARNQTLAADAGQFQVVWYLTFDASRCPL